MIAVEVDVRNGIDLLHFSFLMLESCSIRTICDCSGQVVVSRRMSDMYI